MSVVSYAQSSDSWFVDQALAMQDAKLNNRNILMVFAGSDWCRPCIQFKKDILQDEAFMSYASDHLTILYLDFPAKKKNKLSQEETTHNEALAEQYNQSGAFPKVILMDDSLQKIKEISFKNQSATEFLSAL